MVAEVIDDDAESGGDLQAEARQAVRVGVDEARGLGGADEDSGRVQGRERDYSYEPPRPS